MALKDDGATWRTGDSAFVVFLLLAIALNLLRTASPRWRDETPMTARSLAAGCTATAVPDTPLRRPPRIRRGTPAPAVAGARRVA